MLTIVSRIFLMFSLDFTVCERGGDIYHIICTHGYIPIDIHSHNLILQPLNLIPNLLKSPNSIIHTLFRLILRDNMVIHYLLRWTLILFLIASSTVWYAALYYTSLLLVLFLLLKRHLNGLKCSKVLTRNQLKLNLSICRNHAHDCFENFSIFILGFLSLWCWTFDLYDAR
jgi:hypothetical protein